MIAELRKFSAAIPVLPAIAAAFLLLNSSGAARAQSLTVSPVVLSLLPGQRDAVLTLTNRAETPANVQVRGFEWNQQEDQDALTETNLLIVSPPLAVIAPGDSQVVRLLLRAPAKEKEAAYRLLVDQIPSNEGKGGSVQLALRLSIPLFSISAAKSASQLNFQVEQAGGKWSLVATNRGLRHDFLSDFHLTTSDGRKLLPASSPSPYILAGVTRHWPLTVEGEPLQGSDKLHLTGRTVAGPIDQEVKLAPTP